MSNHSTCTISKKHQRAPTAHKGFLTSSYGGFNARVHQESVLDWMSVPSKIRTWIGDIPVNTHQLLFSVFNKSLEGDSNTEYSHDTASITNDVIVGTDEWLADYPI
jgi:hypothetical protein